MRKRKKYLRTATLVKTFDTPIGKPISHKQALLLVRQTLYEAEERRAIFVESEAEKGIQWENGQ